MLAQRAANYTASLWFQLQFSTNVAKLPQEQKTLMRIVMGIVMIRICSRFHKAFYSGQCYLLLRVMLIILRFAQVVQFRRSNKQTKQTRGKH